MTFKYYAFVDSLENARLQPINGPAEIVQCLQERSANAAGIAMQGSLASDMATAWKLWDAMEDAADAIGQANRSTKRPSQSLKLSPKRQCLPEDSEATQQDDIFSYTQNTQLDITTFKNEACRSMSPRVRSRPLEELPARRVYCSMNEQPTGCNKAALIKRPQNFKSAAAMLEQATVRPVADHPLTGSRMTTSLTDRHTGSARLGTKVVDAAQAGNQCEGSLIFSTASGKKICQSARAQQAALSSVVGLEWATSERLLPKVCEDNNGEASCEADTSIAAAAAAPATVPGTIAAENVQVSQFAMGAVGRDGIVTASPTIHLAPVGATMELQPPQAPCGISANDCTTLRSASTRSSAGMLQAPYSLPPAQDQWPVSLDQQQQQLAFGSEQFVDASAPITVDVVPPTICLPSRMEQQQPSTISTPHQRSHQQPFGIPETGGQLRPKQLCWGTPQPQLMHMPIRESMTTHLPAAAATGSGSLLQETCLAQTSEGQRLSADVPQAGPDTCGAEASKDAMTTPRAGTIVITNDGNACKTAAPAEDAKPLQSAFRCGSNREGLAEPPMQLPPACFQTGAGRPLPTPRHVGSPPRAAFQFSDSEQSIETHSQQACPRSTSGVDVSAGKIPESHLGQSHVAASGSLPPGASNPAQPVFRSGTGTPVTLNKGSATNTKLAAFLADMECSEQGGGEAKSLFSTPAQPSSSSRPSVFSSSRSLLPTPQASATLSARQPNGRGETAVDRTEIFQFASPRPFKAVTPRHASPASTRKQATPQTRAFKAPAQIKALNTKTTSARKATVISRPSVHALERSLFREACRGVDTQPVCVAAPSLDEVQDVQLPPLTAETAMTAATLQTALEQAGCNPTLANLEWTAHHLHMVTWKCCLYETRYPQLKGRLLTAEILLDQMLRRYEREIGRGQVPILSRIFEQDCMPNGAMVLVVAAIRQPDGPGSPPTLVLSDGWYWMVATAPTAASPLMHRLHSGAIIVGDKLRICGAELIAQSAGKALQSCHTARLTLHSNGMARVSHTTRLGRLRNTMCTITPLPAVRIAGGIVPRTVLVILRRYPVVLKLRQASGGFRGMTPSAHHRALARHQAITEIEGPLKVLEELQAQKAASCQQRLRREGARMSPVDRLFCEVMVDGGCGVAAELATLSTPDAERLRRQVEGARLALQDEAMKAATAAQPEGTTADAATACATQSMLVGAVLHQGKARPNARHPPLELIDWGGGSSEAQEGDVYCVYNLRASDSPRWDLQLIANHRTRWQQLYKAPRGQQQQDSNERPLGQQPTLHQHGPLQWYFQPREVFSLEQLPMLPPHSRFDYNGIVVLVRDVEATGRRHRVQWVFLADPSSVHCNQPRAQTSGDTSLPWAVMLAVKMEADPEGLPFLDATAHVGGILQLRDLRLTGYDSQLRMRQAEAREKTAVTILPATRYGHSVVASAAAQHALGPWSVEQQAQLQFWRETLSVRMNG